MTHDPLCIKAPILLRGTIAEAQAYAKEHIFPNGGEGLVGRYEPCTSIPSGARNQDLVKIKSLTRIVGLITGVTPGTEQVWMETDRGVKFSVKAMNRDIQVGSWYSVTCMQVNPNGVPREPVLGDRL